MRHFCNSDTVINTLVFCTVKPCSLVACY